MYASCDRLESARQVFDGMSERSPVAWSSMFSGYVRCGRWEEVVGLFRKMMKMGIGFNEVTLISVLKASFSTRIALKTSVNRVAALKGFSESFILVRTNSSIKFSACYNSAFENQYQFKK